jgi:hypothetical protein
LWEKYLEIEEKSKVFSPLMIDPSLAKWFNILQDYGIVI